MSNQKFISGIYNYCDRWCERCTFTSRCRNYENTGKLSPEQLDINNKSFWDTITANFSKAIELLQKAAMQHGIDINQPMTNEEEEAYKKRETLIKTATKNHQLPKLCKQYQKTVRQFLKESEGLINKTRELVSELHMGLKSEEDVVYTMANLGDCFDIIQWYLFFIDVKLQRALHGKLEGESWEDNNGYARDSDGSAKIAIIAVERSMNAWVKIYELMPSSEDVALASLSLLSKIKRLALQVFPKAMEFKRPGFDN